MRASGSFRADLALGLASGSSRFASLPRQPASLGCARFEPASGGVARESVSGFLGLKPLLQEPASLHRARIEHAPGGWCSAQEIQPSSPAARTTRLPSS